MELVNRNGYLNSAVTQMTPVVMLSILNASCQPVGHYLLDSDMTVAGVALCVATRVIKDINIKYLIINKTLKQYTSKKKIFDGKFFDMLVAFANGGMPEGMNAKVLVKFFEESEKTHISNRQMMITQKQALLSSTVSAMASFQVPFLKVSEMIINKDNHIQNAEEKNGEYGIQIILETIMEYISLPKR